MTSPWLYDESIQIGTDYRDLAEVEAYDRRMGKLRDVAAEARAIREALDVSGESVVWEIGAGTGECALALAATAKRVCASDVSPIMLEYARRKAAARGVANVSFEAGGFLSGFRPERPVDGIVTQLALHHLPDFWKTRALAAMASHLRPGGRLFLRDAVFPTTPDGAESFFEATVNDVRRRGGEGFAHQVVRHVQKEFSTLDWIMEGMIERSGLRIVRRSEPGFFATYVCEKPDGRASGN